MSVLRAVPPPDARVLVIDDDRDLCEALCEVLSDAGYQVASAANGFDALRVLAAADPLPDLIIIDLMMPVMDGYEFRRAQLSEWRIAGIPTIALSAGPLDGRIQALRLAAWMAKPISVEALVGAVERHRLRRASEVMALGAPGGHSVHFYDSDERLAADVARFLAPAVRTGSALVVATEAHWQLYEEALAQAGCDPAAARASGALQVMEARETLGSFLRHGRVNERRFIEEVTPQLAAAERLAPRVRVYGEMVDLLWQAGEISTAVALEQCWNRLLATARCDLHCSYAAPTTPSQRAAVDWIRLQHSDTIAA
jgi:DNA-binding response OmpR family regulator